MLSHIYRDLAFGSLFIWPIVYNILYVNNILCTDFCNLIFMLLFFSLLIAYVYTKENENQLNKSANLSSNKSSDIPEQNNKSSDIPEQNNKSSDESTFSDITTSSDQSESYPLSNHTHKKRNNIRKKNETN